VLSADDNAYGVHQGSSAGRLVAPQLQQQQQQRERTRSQSGGSSKLQHDPSLSSFLTQPHSAAGDSNADVLHAYGGSSSSRQGSGHSPLKHQQQQQQQQQGSQQEGIRSRAGVDSWQQQQQRPASVVSDDAGSRSALDELLDKLNEGQPTLQDLAELEGLL
jgi:hypothetical protein